MNIKKTLQNPFFLIGQGFVAGAIIFFATAPAESDPQQPQPTTASSASAEISRA